MGDERIEAGGLSIAAELASLLADEIAPETGVAPDHFWAALGEIVRDLGPKNAALLARRKVLQFEIDRWLQERAGEPVDAAEQEAFLREIGYLLDDAEAFEVMTRNVDPEIAELAGPQLVVPVDNARYALNAANARWGSLYDALYGTDVIAEQPGTERGTRYNSARGALVVQRAAEWLDETVPLVAGSYAQVAEFTIDRASEPAALAMRLIDGRVARLVEPAHFAGYRCADGRVVSVLLVQHGLHVEIVIDPEHPVGRQHPAGVCDVILESALTTIQDCEDSVAAVDAADKARVYRNWLGLMRGTLSADIEKAGSRITRRPNPDRSYTAPDGGELVLTGRSLLLVRHVGSHMYTDAVLTADGQPIPEAFLDAMFTCLAASHDLRGHASFRNSRTGSIYVVKPKQHGPAEVTASCELFARVEQALGLAPLTIKIGIMDEERRTSVNLAACLHMARERVIFINTGFLDRTGDEIHTMMAWGPVLPKEEIKSTPWMLAYEDRNVAIGLASGMAGRGQIGKGMWAMPDAMAAMLEAKIAHPQAGASTAWVPSPVAATLHALHYHRVDVRARQLALRDRPPAPLSDLLTLPALDRQLSGEAIERELENNAQGILGYVVRWVEQGIGCSKVPDIRNQGLMEDRATLRISSQHIANWLRHGLVSRGQVMTVFERMAAVVDAQNADDPAYRSMAPDFDHSVAFQAALELVLLGEEQPNGYTEAVLTKRRREFKRRLLEESAAA